MATLGRGHRRRPPTTTAGYVVLDADLPDRSPLDDDAALHVLAVVQEEFCDQLDANGQGGHAAQLALALATTGAIGPPFYFETIDGMRPSQR